MLVKGCFDEYPLLLLLDMFLHRKETGLLEISCPTGPGYLYIKDGELRDVVIGKMRGAEAFKFASELNGAYFEFNALSHAEYAGLVWRLDSSRFHKSQGAVKSAYQSLSILLGQLFVYALLSYRSLKKSLRSIWRQSVHTFYRQTEFWRTTAITKLQPKLRAALSHGCIAFRTHRLRLQGLTLKREQKLRSSLGSLKARTQKLSLAIPRIRVAHISIAAAGIVILLCTIITISEIRWLQNQQASDSVPNVSPNSSSQSQSKETAPKSSKRRRRSKN